MPQAVHWLDLVHNYEAVDGGVRISLRSGGEVFRFQCSRHTFRLLAEHAIRFANEMELSGATLLALTLEGDAKRRGQRRRVVKAKATPEKPS